MLLFASYGRKEAYVTRKLPIILLIKEKKKTAQKKALQLSNTHKAVIKKQRKIILSMF